MKKYSNFAKLINLVFIMFFFLIFVKSFLLLQWFIFNENNSFSLLIKIDVAQKQHSKKQCLF